jgi:hypothetical protein
VCLSNRHSRSYDWGGKRLIMDGERNAHSQYVVVIFGKVRKGMEGNSVHTYENCVSVRL